MPITKKTPARLEPSEGETTATCAPKPTAAFCHRQAGCSLSDEDIRRSVWALSAASDISWKPDDHLHEVLNHFLGFSFPLDARRVRFWKAKTADSWQLMVEQGGRINRLGDLTIVASQAGFQRALLRATGHYRPILLKTYRPAIWHVVAQCILKVARAKTVRKRGEVTHG